MTTLYQAIYETETGRVYIEYEPGPNGAIFILSVSTEPRPVTLFQDRRNKRRRGIVLNEQEQHSEATQPYTARENLVRRTR